MENLNLKCPDKDTIYKYFRMELDNEQLLSLNKHFAFCDKCLNQYNYFDDYISTRALSSNVIKEIWKDSDIDTFEYAAADSHNNKDFELTSSKGKYIAKLLQYASDPCINLLVINVLIDSKGKLRVSHIKNGKTIPIGEEDIDGLNEFCFSVSSDIVLKELIIDIVNN
ncbi:hypothetical protein [Pseudobacteroides cellulosolvens]|uniref:Zinc-finger domain-containing protein n=1 Tax=Pseudobacteroides cellulosolvens ATCC 35603 = DSM 2933 TaxID=398512 RepID=A0A0L6JJI5_9FIRM|nr:hypothetical protein [Pseudobacteroides cellulosolvens]KNY25572.1 hypothetical protein Bccel_0832 [Pseudobacteroides cellulosolvens ATCC 35603 = DSM 2933]